MKRLLSVLVLVCLAAFVFSSSARADGRRAIVEDASGRPIGALVLCANPAGGFTATLVRRDGTVLCGPSQVVRTATGEFAFLCNGFRFVFGCDRTGCFWHAGQRHGTLSR
jgi:hypothetical protein